MRILLLYFASILLLVQSPLQAANIPGFEAGDPIQLISHASQYVTVTGKISNTDTSERSKVIFLNFGQNYNTSFSAIIYDNVVPAFIMAGIEDPAEYYNNKLVALEGVIRISNGKPEMIIDSPSQIKVINVKKI